MEKIVMKNQKTGQFWCPDCFPPMTTDVWKAEKYDTISDAKGSVHALMADKYSPKDFEPVKITLTEESV